MEAYIYRHIYQAIVADKPMKLIAFYVPPEMWNRIGVYAKKMELPKAEVARKALIRFLQAVP